jgi:hypothetical protein
MTTISIFPRVVPTNEIIAVFVNVAKKFWVEGTTDLYLGHIAVNFVNLTEP